MGTSTYSLTSYVKITLSWKHSTTRNAMLDLSAFLLADDGELQGLDCVVFYGSLINEKGQYHCSDDCIVLDRHKQNNGAVSQVMQVDLEKISSSIRTIVLVISLDAKKLISKFSCVKVRIEDEKEVLWQMPIDYVNDDAVGGIIVGNIYRYGESWRYENEESIFTGGLEIPYYRWISRKLKYEAISFDREELHKQQELKKMYENEKKKGVPIKSGEAIKEQIIRPVSPNKQRCSFGTMPKSKKSTIVKTSSKQTRDNNNNKFSAVIGAEAETTSVKTTAKDNLPKTKLKKVGAKGIMPYKNNHK